MLWHWNIETSHTHVVCMHGFLQLKQANNKEKPMLHIHDSLELENEPLQRHDHMYNTWGWHLEWTAIDNGDEYIMENKDAAIFEAMHVAMMDTLQHHWSLVLTHVYELMRHPDLLGWIRWLQQMREWPPERLQKDLIHYLQQKWHGHQGGWWNTQWKNETKYLVWHFIATLACIHLCFWHRKQCLPLTIPWGQWWHKHTSYNTMGTVETQIYKNYDTMGTVVRLMIPREQCWDSGETYDTMGTVLRQWWWHKIFLMTKICDKRCWTTW